MNSKHIEHSSYRENLIEHLFVGELLKISWQNGDCQLEVAKPEVDNAGYDLVLDANGVIRHVQLKATFVGAKTAKQNINIKLADKPSGCVIWLVFEENTLDLQKFLFFGSQPGQPLPSLENAKVAKHTKGDSDGYKAEREKFRKLYKGKFDRYCSTKEIYRVLFGE